MPPTNGAGPAAASAVSGPRNTDRLPSAINTFDTPLGNGLQRVNARRLRKRFQISPAIALLLVELAGLGCEVRP